MPEIILGVVVLALLLWLSNAFAAVDARRLAPALRLAGGLGALGGALFLASRGVFVIALPLGSYVPTFTRRVSATGAAERAIESKGELVT